MLRRIDRNHYLYIAVIVAVAAGAIVGLAAPEFAKTLDPVGKGFVALIKMMIAPVIFCTIVIGVGSIAKAATVGKIAAGPKVGKAADAIAAWGKKQCNYDLTA